MYENILNALSGGKVNQLTYEDSARNYALFDELQKKGVKLEDLIRKANAADDELRVNPAVFTAMEKAVADRPEVKAAKADLERARDEAMRELLRSCPAYMSAETAYRDAVGKAYTSVSDVRDQAGPPSEFEVSAQSA